MRKILHFLNRWQAVCVLYLLLTFSMLFQLFTQKGVILGGDWSWPVGFQQVHIFFEKGIYTWTTIGNIFGVRNLSTSTVLMVVFMKISSSIGISGELFAKILIIFIFTLGEITFYFFLRYLRIKPIISFLGGLIYSTMPIFFNYLAMGWVYLIFSLVVFPIAVLFFIKGIKEKKYKYLIFLQWTFLFVFQPNLIIWLFLIFFFLSVYLIKDKHSCYLYLRYLFFSAFFYLLINLYWLLGLVVILDKRVVGSDIFKSAVSLGITSNFYPLNIIRTFGSLFNFQFETIVNNTKFPLLSFVLPILAVGALFIKSYKKIALAFWFISLVPFFMYSLTFYRDFLLYIPFSNVVRDFARFTALSSFGYSFLIVIFLNFLFQDNHYGIIKKTLGIFFIILWFLSLSPWWKGELFKWENETGRDQRLRIKEFPDSYFKLEELFSTVKLDKKAMYLPIGGNVEYTDDPKFYGMFKGSSDIFANYSPIEGSLITSDRSFGHISTFVGMLSNELKEGVIDLIKVSNIGNIVVRKNIKMIGQKKILDRFDTEEQKNSMRKFLDDDKVISYTINSFLPHFYAPQTLIINNQSVDALPGIVSQPDYKIRSAIYFEGQNQTKSEGLKVIKSIKSEAEKGTATETAKIAEEVAQCVTGDTVLRRRRRKSKVKSQKSKVTGGWDPEDFEDVRIDEIEEGDEILTLDEDTGEFIPQGVEKLMDMGIRDIYELSTEDGRSIRTTSNHPYLSIIKKSTGKSKWLKVMELKKGMEIAVLKKQTALSFAFIDETGIAAHTDTQPYFGVGVFTTDKTSELNKELHDILVKALSFYKITKDKFEFKFSHIYQNNLKFYKQILAVLKKYRSHWSFNALVEDKMGKNWTQSELWENYLTKVKEILSQTSQEKVVIADYLSKPNLAKEDFDVLTQISSIRNVMQLESQGSLLLQVSDILLGAVSFTLKRGKKKVKREIAKEVMKLLKEDKKMRVTQVTCSPSTKQYTTKEFTCQEKNKLDWVKIKSIKKVGREKVYDIEVEGTHNFVGNGIVAHNTHVDENSKFEIRNSKMISPVLEFRKINPTKYRVRVHGAKGTFPVVFSESFHEGWKTYLVKPDRNSKFEIRNSKLDEYKILDGNEEDQATEEEIEKFIEMGWLTVLGDGKEKEVKHLKYESGREKLDYVEKYKIDFVSKNFQDTIQNDNLPKGPIWETWLSQRLASSKSSKDSNFSLSDLLTFLPSNKNVLQLPDDNHLMVNGYANSWIIDPNEVCSSNSKLPTSNFCIKNADGSYDLELIVEFWPQRLFYIGLGISGMTLLGCISYLIYDWRRRRSSPLHHLRVY